MTERHKYFGTDGFRGEAGVGLTSAHAYKIGRFLGYYLSSLKSERTEEEHRARILIGKDTRRSSYMLEYSIAAGICASGADVHMLHVTTTPSVSYVTRTEFFDAGVMITASHNPYYDNGIKILNRYGEKLEDSVTELIEEYLDGDLSSLGIKDGDIPEAKRADIGSIFDHVGGRNRYIGYLISTASNSFKRLRIGIDSANGASHMIAKTVFDALGAQTYVIGAEPDGLNINEGCGSTHTERLSALVKERGLDIGFAFDGDADRCIAVDENGNVVDGDAIIFILAKRLLSLGMLNKNTVAVTVMSNSGFVRSLGSIGVNCIETKVGDRFVYEEMQRSDLSLGGEQSGHIIMRKYATTGDGILTAIMLCEEMCDRKMSAARLCEGLKIYPQKLINLTVKDKALAISDPRVEEAAAEVRRRIEGKGRLLIRESGTEPKIRIMVETEDESECEALAEIVADAVRAGGHTV